MKITNKIIENLDSDDYSENIKLFTLSIFMHKFHIINDDRLKAIFTKLRTGFNSRERKNTYHCTINDKWYNDEYYIEIMKNAFYTHHEFPNSSYEMKIEDLIKYTNLYLNKPRNYCIDWIRSNYINSLSNKINDYNGYRIKQYLEDFGVDISSCYVSYDNYEPNTSYCCEDCDGPWEDVKSNSYRYAVIDKTKSYLESESFLEDYKKKYPHFQKQN